METKIVKTPVDKIEVELKTFITGREKRALKSVFLKGMKVEMDGDKPKSVPVDMEKLTADAEDIAFTTVVVSVNGVKEKIVDAILDMNSKDSDFVIAEVNKVTKDDDFLSQTKKPSSITEPIN